MSNLSLRPGWRTMTTMCAMVVVVGTSILGYRIGRKSTSATVQPTPVVVPSPTLLMPRATGGPRSPRKIKGALQEVEALLDKAKSRDETALIKAEIMMYSFSVDELAAVIEQIDAMWAGPKRDFMRRLAITALSREVPDIALEYVLAAGHLDLVPLPFAELAKRDPEATLAKTRELADTLKWESTVRSNIVGKTFEAWIERDFEEALDAYLKVYPDERFAAASPFERLLDKRDDTARSEYLELVESLPESSGREHLIKRAMRRLAKTDERDAIDWLERLGLEGEAADEARDEIASGWLDRDPSAAASWQMASVTSDLQKHKVLFDLAMNWQSRDIEGWEAWMREQGYNADAMDHYTRIIRDGNNANDLNLYIDPNTP